VSAGTTKSGVAHFWWQRLTAVALVPLGLWFVISLLNLNGLDYDRVADWLMRSVNAFGTALFVLVAILHSQLGLQVVIEDYVHDARAQRAVILLAAAAHVLVAAAGVLAVIRIAGGSGP
jgi:succinate dehydrogenase / fumarate reductase membrane anchor subunit